MDQLVVANIQRSEVSNVSKAKILGLSPQIGKRSFILETCQRVLVISRYPEIKSELVDLSRTLPVELTQSSKAYEQLLQVVCGLQSRLVGESEIVAQFKTGFENYLNLPQRDPVLLKLFQKVLQDSKNIRRNYLHKVGQYSYCGLTKKIIKDFCEQAEGKTLNLFGSGKMAEDLIKVLSKNFRLNVFARNTKRLSELQEKYQISPHSWHGISSELFGQVMINTIGCESVKFKADFFHKLTTDYDRCLFIDLSSPAALSQKESMAHLLGHRVQLFELQDIFEQVKILSSQKKTQVKQALEATQLLSLKRADHLNTKTTKVLSHNRFQNQSTVFA